MCKGVENGQVYLSADGGTFGYVVIDAEKYRDINNVIVQGFFPNKVEEFTRDIDAWKLAHCRYYLVEGLPEWAPKDLLNEVLKCKK